MDKALNSSELASSFVMSGTLGRQACVLVSSPAPRLTWPLLRVTGVCEDQQDGPAQLSPEKTSSFPLMSLEL